MNFELAINAEERERVRDLERLEGQLQVEMYVANVLGVVITKG